MREPTAASQRKPTEFTARLGTSSKPPMGQARLGTPAGRPITGAAGRLGTGMTRPGTGNRVGTAGGGPVVTARPLTQQGLAGAKASTQLGRQVQDGHFFYSKLSEKMAQVADANEGLRSELEAIDKNRSRQEQLQSRLEELKDEVTTAEVHLRDYNLIVQKAAVQASVADVEETLGTVNQEVSQLNSRLQSVTSSRINAQSKTETLEEEVFELEQQMEMYLSSMPAEERSAYVSAQAEVNQWKAEALRLEEDSSSLTKEIHDLQATIAKSRVKEEALEAQTTLRSLQAEKIKADEAHASLQDLAGAVEAAQAQAQRNTSDLEALKSSVRELASSIKALEGSSANAGQRMHGNIPKDEQLEKFQALVAKQAEIEGFLEDADRMRAQIKESTVATGIRIREEVTTTSKLLAMSSANGSNPQGLSELQDALALKQAQKKSSAATAAKLEEELEARKDELVKVEQLEEKLDKEAATIAESLGTLQDELQTYQNFEALTEEADARQERLQNLLEGLRTRGTMLADVAAAKENMVNVKAGHLMASTWFQEFQLLENKLRDACCETHRLQEAVQAEAANSDLDPVIESMRQVLNPLNAAVQKAV